MEQSVFQGGMVTFNFNVMPDSVFGGTVTIVCPASSQLPALTTCTPNPSSVTVTPGTAAPFSVTFATTFDGVLGGTASSALPAAIPGGRASPPSNRVSVDRDLPRRIVYFSPDLYFGAHFRIARQRFGQRTDHLAWASAVLLLACATVFLGGCHHSSIPEGLNTPVGTTNLTIRGAAQNAGRGNTIILDVVAH